MSLTWPPRDWIHPTSSATRPSCSSSVRGRKRGRGKAVVWLEWLTVAVDVVVDVVVEVAVAVTAAAA